MMASFAKLGLNNKVIDVLYINNSEMLDSNGNEVEKIGIDFLTILTGWSVWKQTSYNTLAGVHNSGGVPFRKNYAGIGFTYDEDRDAFIPPKPFPSFILNEDTCRWDSPVPYPVDGKTYQWDESNIKWIEIAVK
jgi:hypothetical protein